MTSVLVPAPVLYLRSSTLTVSLALSIAFSVTFILSAAFLTARWASFTSLAIASLTARSSSFTFSSSTLSLSISDRMSPPSNTGRVRRIPRYQFSLKAVDGPVFSVY
ncbi:MAG: hypothetical protein A4E57_04514 [Syntrophorhabdaceae bacterium PtaU1.Bin034]|nr:MAG: hypothetical protein A4E57_04514 [Syntrophorhabdaceae bacterium PtaU1.Bin034]